MPKTPLNLVGKVKSAFHLDDKGKRNLNRTEEDRENVLKENQPGSSREASDLAAATKKKIPEPVSTNKYADNAELAFFTKDKVECNLAETQDKVESAMLENAIQVPSATVPKDETSANSAPKDDLLGKMKPGLSIEEKSPRSQITPEDKTEVHATILSNSANADEISIAAANDDTKNLDHASADAAREAPAIDRDLLAYFNISQDPSDSQTNPFYPVTLPHEIDPEFQKLSCIDDSSQFSGSIGPEDSSSLHNFRLVQEAAVASGATTRKHGKAPSTSSVPRYYEKGGTVQRSAGAPKSNLDPDSMSTIVQSVNVPDPGPRKPAISSAPARSLSGADPWGLFPGPEEKVQVLHSESPPSDITEPFPALYPIDANGLVILTPSQVNLIGDETSVFHSDDGPVPRNAKTHCKAADGQSATVNQTDPTDITKIITSTDGKSIVSLNEHAGNGKGPNKENSKSPNGAIGSENSLTSQPNKGKDFTAIDLSNKVFSWPGKTSAFKKPLVGGFKKGSYKDYMLQSDSEALGSSLSSVPSTYFPPLGKNDRIVQSALTGISKADLAEGTSSSAADAGKPSASGSSSQKPSTTKPADNKSSTGDFGARKPSYQLPTSSTDAKKTPPSRLESQIPRRSRKTIPDAAKHPPSQFSALSDLLNSPRKAKKETVEVGTATCDKSTQTDDTLPEKDGPQ